MTDWLLEVEALRTQFFAEGSVTRAVDDISFAIAPGETLGLVGESGCGKSVTALSVMRLLPKNGRVVGGGIRFDGRDLLALSEAEMRQIRGNRIAMIFQEPMTSLNPLHTIGEQIAEALRIHDAPRRLRDHPHQFSGWMRQRAMIAMALACSPRLLIADEPTTALDVTIQAQILRLMLELKQRIGAAILMITHDLGVVAETCQRVIVMYAGRIVEEASVEALFDHPAHPYTRGLMGSIPRGADRRRRRLAEIPGVVPNLAEPLIGCAFAPRCPLVTDACRVAAPELRTIGPGHRAACIRAEAV